MYSFAHIPGPRITLAPKVKATMKVYGWILTLVRNFLKNVDLKYTIHKIYGIAADTDD